MPQLNPEAGIPAVQLVGPETTKEELLEIYLEVYKLHRLPRFPPGEPAVLKEVMASLPDSPRCKEVFQGVALPKKEGEDSPQTPCTTDVSKAHCAPEPALEGRAPKFLGWERVLHPIPTSGSPLGRSPN